MIRRILLNILFLTIVSFNLQAMDKIKPEAAGQPTQQSAPESFFEMLTNANENARNACHLIEIAGQGQPIQKRNYSLNDIEIALFLISRQLTTIDRNPSFHTNDERNWYIGAKVAITLFQKSMRSTISVPAASTSALSSASSSSATTVKTPASQSNNASSMISEFMIAAENGDAPRVTQLIAAGVNVNATGADGKTALMFAAKNGHSAIVKILIAADASVNATQNNGATALMLAAFSGSVETVTILLKADAYIDAYIFGPKNKWGTALMFAANNAHATIVELLLDYGANTKMLNDRNETAYDMVIIKLNMLNARSTNDETLRTELNAVKNAFIKHHANITGQQVIAERQLQTSYTSRSASTDTSGSSASLAWSKTATCIWSIFVAKVLNEVCFSTFRSHIKTVDEKDMMTVFTILSDTIINDLRDLYPALGQCNSSEAFIKIIMDILMNHLLPQIPDHDENDFRTDVENALCTLLKRDSIISMLFPLLGFKLQAAAGVVRANNHHDDDDDSTPGAMSSYERKQWQKVVKIKPVSFTNSHNAHWGLTALMTLGTHALHKHMVPGQKTSAGIQLLSAAAAA